MYYHIASAERTRPHGEVRISVYTDIFKCDTCIEQIGCDRIQKVIIPVDRLDDFIDWMQQVRAVAVKVGLLKE